MFPNLAWTRKWVSVSITISERNVFKLKQISLPKILQT